MHEPPTLGQASIIHALERLHWYVVDQQASSSFLEIGIQLLAILVVFGLYWLDHGERTYLWLGLICTISLIFVSLSVVQSYATWVGSRSLLLPLIFGMLPPLQIGLWLMFWGYWFRLERTVWLKWIYATRSAFLLFGISRPRCSFKFYYSAESRRVVYLLQIT
jgi:hypothetical protein